MIELLAGEECEFELVWYSKVIALEIADLPDVNRLSRVEIEGSCFSPYYIIGGRFRKRVLFTDYRMTHSVVRFFDLDGRPTSSCVLLISKDLVEIYNRINHNYNKDMYPHNKSTDLLMGSASARTLPFGTRSYNRNIVRCDYLRVYVVDERRGDSMLEDCYLVGDGYMIVISLYNGNGVLL